MTGGIDYDDVLIQSLQRLQQENVQETEAEQETSKEAFVAWQKESYNPFADGLKKTEKKREPTNERVKKSVSTGEKAGDAETSKYQNKAEEFATRKNNPEIRSTTLVVLRNRIKPDHKQEDILKTLREVYPDVTLADDVFEFLLDTTDGDLHLACKAAQKEFQTANEREITAGRNIAQQAREAADKGLGTPTSMRDLYRNITNNPRDATTLFHELSQRYEFKDLKKVTDFLLHSLGADMKSRGPSIPKGQLHRFLAETRSLQAILGVYRFFKSRMGLVTKQFTKEGLELPSQLNFETMSKQFMALCGERYPSGEKVLQTAVRLGIEKWIMAKIIVLSQLRDAIREVAVNQIYRSLQHRDELYLAILEALEDLEDELEELMGREEEGEEGEEEEEEDDEESEE